MLGFKVLVCLPYSACLANAHLLVFLDSFAFEIREQCVPEKSIQRAHQQTPEKTKNVRNQF